MRNGTNGLDLQDRVMGIVELVQMYQLVRLSPNRKGRLAHCAPLAKNTRKESSTLYNAAGWHIAHQWPIESMVLFDQWPMANGHTTL